MDSNFSIEENAQKPPFGDLGVYDTAIVGGGLAGLALSIQLSKKSTIFNFDKFKQEIGKNISNEWLEC